MTRIMFFAPVLAGLALAVPAKAQDLGTIIQQVAPALLGQQPQAPVQQQLHPQDDRNRNGVPDWEERRPHRDAYREEGRPHRDAHRDERRALREEERRLAERERRLEERRRQLDAERRSLDRRW
ncbi:hypothetical protein [Sabulicella glaciei]|uniref:Uncharacterized protein n=1 Tax=Sabulicella glaciei TaxID=2984948 RepID=A0ABT3NRA1_9PROT|nr:hypothetical protein [Roseococcus sp. MDT2-1-1]MCW8084662.1 hypothetical protein [Roseococcus sp. MDT2-1-1]